MFWNKAETIDIQKHTIWSLERTIEYKKITIKSLQSRIDDLEVLLKAFEGLLDIKNDLIVTQKQLLMRYGFDPKDLEGVEVKTEEGKTEG